MKNLILTSLIAMAFVSCRTVSYDNAVHSNQDKFYGDDENTALLLVDLKDVSQVMEDMSMLADHQAYAKDICDFADVVIEDQHKFRLSLQIVALKKRIKLPTFVGPERQKIYHQIQVIRDKRSFDKFYLDNMDQLIQFVSKSSDDYLDKNKEGTVREFIAKQTGKYKDYVKKIEQMREYMDKKDPQVSTTTVP